jgi:hypothetical protein
MERRQLFILALSAIVAGGVGSAAVAAPPETWDGLVKQNSKRLKYVYLAPGADFRGYRSVMLDPTEIAFEKNWQRDYNSTTRGLGTRVTDQDIERAVSESSQSATEVFQQAFAAGGYPIAAAPGPDVLRVRTGIMNIRVTSPDTMSAGRSRSYSAEAGSATLVVEARDSVSGALLGRAVDSKLAGDTSFMMSRSRATNRSDFRRLAQDWAKVAVNGLNELKRLSPVSG